MRLPAARRPNTPRLDALRLRDRVRAPVGILFVGINPGVRSALTGHHFAGYSNRFWKLLYASGIVSEPLTAEDDVRLPEWQCGITNLVPRPTSGIASLRPSDYVSGQLALRRKMRRWRPRIVALVGVTLFRALFNTRPGERVLLGPQTERLEGVPVFVLPNPRGRNANYTYREMLAAFTALRKVALTPNDQMNR